MKPDGYVPDILIRGLSVKPHRGQGPKKFFPGLGMVPKVCLVLVQGQGPGP